MRKIFIDCGAHNGCSILKFKMIKKDWRQFKMYSFEASPIFYDLIRETGTKLIPKAVWIEDTHYERHSL